MLDDLHGDPDLEPSLGATHEVDQRLAWLRTIQECSFEGEDLEDEHDGGEPETG